MNIEEIKNELTKEYKYRIELHAHTSPASSCSEVPPEELVKIYKNLGFHGVTISNHFTFNKDGLSKEETVKRFCADFVKAEKTGNDLGIKVYFAAEIRFTENDNDYLIYGIDKKMLEEIYDLLPYGVEGFRKNYSIPESIFVQAHPFRNNMVQVSPSLLDGIEVFNMHPNHNSRVGIASVYARENNIPIITSGSDFHHPGKRHEGVSAIRTKYLPEDCFSLASLLRESDYLIEIGGSFLVLP